MYSLLCDSFLLVIFSFKYCYENCQNLNTTKCNNTYLQEMGELEKEYAAKKRMMVDDALNRLSDKYDKLRDEMMKRHDQELADLLVKFVYEFVFTNQPEYTLSTVKSI